MIERLGQALSGVSFHRGLALGALVGAAIAGSTIWTRLRDVRDTAATATPRQRPSAPADPRSRTEG